METIHDRPAELWNRSTPIWAPVDDPVDWRDYDVRMTIIRSQVRQTGDKPVVGAGMDVPGARRVRMLFRCQDARNGYEWTVDPEAGELAAAVRIDDVVHRIGSAKWEVGMEPEVSVTVTLRGNAIITSVQGREVSLIRDDVWSGGDAGLGAPADARSLVSTFAVTDPSGHALYTLTKDSPLDCGDFDDDGRFLVAERSRGLTANGAAWAFLRREFTLGPERAVAEARLYVTASSAEPARQFIYRVGVNGTVVGCGPVRSIADEIRYDAYDVTDLLRHGVGGGVNCIGIQAWTPSDQRVQAELYVNYDDGMHTVIGTDSAWQALDGDSAYERSGSIGTGYYSAPRENLRADRYPWGFDRPGLGEVGSGDSQWSSAVERPSFDRDRSGRSSLLANPGRNVSLETCVPSRVDRSATGSLLLDFGKTLVGGIELPWREGLPESTVTIRYGELPQADGSPKWRTNAGNHYLDVWNLGSEAAGHTVCTWGLRVFRYVEIDGLSDDFGPSAIRGIGHVYPLYGKATSADPSVSTESVGGLGAIDSDDKNLNRIVVLCRNTMEQINGNLLVDSWNREREAYEADAYLQARCNAAISDDTALADYSLDYLLERRTWPTEWPFYLVLMARDQYLRSGDTERLRNRYDALERLLPTRWLDASTGLVRKNFGNDGTGSRMDYDIVDWPPSERDGYQFGPVNTVVNAVAYGAYQAMSRIDDALGVRNDVHAAIADRLRESMNRMLWDDSAGMYVDGLDPEGRRFDHHAAHASAFAVAMGAADEVKARSAAQGLAERGMVVSVYAAPFLLEALMVGGQCDAAYDLLTGSGLRSWNGMMGQGAGSTMEAWSQTLKPNVSCAHPWSASPLFIVVESFAGIRATSGDFRTFDVRPMLPHVVNRLDVTLPTRLGGVVVNQRRDGNVVQLHIVVPRGAVATLKVGGRSDTTLTSGSYDLALAG